MQQISLSESSKKKLIEDLLLKIENNSFHVVFRENSKNKDFMRRFRIVDKEGVKEILKKISVDNLQSVEFDNEVIKYGLEEVVIFHIECSLTDFHGEVNNVKVYVKIKNKENDMPVISLHECER